MNEKVGGIHLASQFISLSSYISTSTRVTSVHSFGIQSLIVTADSASTSEKDIFLFSIATTTGVISLISSIDAGPGIQDSVLLGDFLYIANTSVNSHVKSFHINMTATGTAMFTELSNIRIASLASSLSNPKKLSVYNQNLILGSEKSNTGPELFVIPIGIDGVVRAIDSSIELNGQLNQSLSAHEYLYVANAADPELRVLTKSWQEFFSYDAPLTLGNGKSLIFINPYIILGRTLGSAELSLLHNSGTTTEVLDVKRTNGTVDFLQEFSSSVNSASSFLAITANESKELQFWHIESSIFGPHIILDKDIDIPGRVTAYTCISNTMYLFMSVNNQTILTWLNL